MGYKNRICALLNIEYPILCGGMQWLSRAELVAAVSNGGGLGFLSATTFPDKAALVEEIRRTQRLTDKPFGVNISMLPGKSAAERAGAYMEAVVETGVPVVETSGRSPGEFVELLHSHGIKLIHKVPAVRYAKKAEEVGADAVTVVGFECGGHPGLDDVPGLVLIPQAAKALHIPLLAGGGIADARGYLAARMLGADGVVMGTRFLLSEECGIHPQFRERLLHTDETGTKVIQYSIRNPIRALHNRAADQVAEMERQRAGLEQLLTVTNGQNGRRCWMEGDTENGIQAVGQCVGLIHDVKPAGEIIREIVSGAEELAASFRLP